MAFTGAGSVCEEEELGRRVWGDIYELRIYADGGDIYAIRLYAGGWM
jgi:hypothetical protein